MAYYIFCEPEPGVVAHTSLSRALVEVPNMGTFVEYLTAESKFTQRQLFGHKDYSATANIR